MIVPATWSSTWRWWEWRWRQWWWWWWRNESSIVSVAKEKSKKTWLPKVTIQTVDKVSPCILLDRLVDKREQKLDLKNCKS
ncbi:hypothetical protein BpHYR1_006040 [Brachionus plicatilis]|uniref:Uncharacterized protein n=1 Tax=Brachionus plicatilis TaxID=10195 RepID=A0A3M7RBB2_BRAPC|nr:hypothetical protein BpHYR1_006040 [Brachionus plicatilis]